MAASLELVPDWGASGVPDNLSMYTYVPDDVVENPPILVLMHYWGGGAGGVFAQAQAGGIVAAADQYGFIMVVPETPDCWDYDSVQSLTRDGGGQTQGIAQMVEYAINAYDANPDRVYVTGDSCGGMMTQAMLGVYPDMFKAGAAFCGVPVGGAWTPITRTALQWGDIVRNINPGYSGPWPRIQLWHGTEDELVSYANQGQAILQWTNVQGLSTTPTATAAVNMNGSDWTRQVWQDVKGNTLVEAWSETGGTHSIGSLFDADFVIPFLGLDVAGPVDPEKNITIPRGRPTLNAERTTFVADNGELLRGPYTSSEWGDPAPANQIASMKNLGFNAVHLYGECFDINYPNPGSTAPGYAASRIDSVVAATRNAGMYLVLTIGNGANNGNYNINYVVDFWDFYAARYANEAHVLFEIQNEPVAWGPPYLTHTNPPGAMDMEIAAYNKIRSHAPHTPVLLFSYAVPWGSGGANDAMVDVRYFNQEVFGNENAVWTNEAVAIHGYSGASLTSEFAAAMIGYGYPCFQTEFAGGIWGEEGGRFELYTASEMERRKVSWMAFQFIPPWGVSDNIAIPKIYKDLVDRSGMSWTPDFGIWPQVRGPYGNGGQPRSTTGLSGTLRIQAEDFDTGGQGVAYNDTSRTNQGGQYRLNEGVDIETTSDTGGGYNVGWTEDGEWMEYAIHVTQPGFYNLRLRVASSNTGRAARVSSYNLDKTGVWTIPNTGGTQNWTTITKQVFLEYGRQKLRVEIVTGGFNLNWIELSPITSGPLANGTYKLANQNSGMVVENSSRTIVQNAYTGTNTQQWNLQHIGAGQYRVRSAVDNWQWTTFILRPLGDGYYRLVREDSGLDYEVENASLAGGAEIVSHEYAGSASQKWGILSPSAPAFPISLTAEWVSSTQVDLMWTASAGATSYNVKRSATSGGPYSTIAASVTTTSYSDTDVINGKVYYYVVSANTASGESLNSNQAVVTPWTSQDVGAVGVTGSTNYSDGVFTVSGSGADIWGTADAFRFVYLPVTGDCTIIARVASVQNTDSWAKAGVMIRESLNANARNAFIAVTPGNGVTWQYRSSTGGSTNNNNTTGLGAPYWVKLVRSGSTFTGYRSPDGTTWTQQGTSQSITMASTVYLGMAVTSHNNSSLCQATFDNITAPGWPPPLAPTAPTGLTATRAFDTQINLTWNMMAGATSYNIKRSAASGGPYTTIATDIPTAAFGDTNVNAGQIYYYVVSANTPEGESPDSYEATTIALHAYLKFDETSGTAAPDATGNGWNGTLVNGPTWTAGKFANAVDLDGSNDYVTLPTGVVDGLTEVTISTWVYLDSVSNWSRVFDFGNDTNVYMFLTPRNGVTGTVRFAITTNSNGSEDIINGPQPLPTGVWTHVAVMLGGGTGVLYVNGQEVGRNSSMTLTPDSLGATTNNKIGWSQWTEWDPYLNGRIDDFRIYPAALSADQVETLYAVQVPAANPSTPTGLSATAVSGSEIDLTWNDSSGATNYTIKRSPTDGGPYTFAASVGGTSYHDTGLPEKATWYYVVSAVNGVGQSADSTQAAATTLAAPLAVPSGLAAAAGDGFVMLDWNANTEGDLAGYNVYRSTTSGSGYALQNGSLLNSPGFVDDNVNYYTTYYYVVTAVDDDAIESTYSDEVEAVPFDGRAVRLSGTDFESGLGDWVNITDEDTHNWTHNSNGTQTPNTGPSGGANDSVWYVYLETSPGGANTAGNAAILQSPLIAGFGRILTFYYHMYGVEIGTLNVDVYDGVWHNGVWSLSGQQHNSVSEAYTQALVDLSGYTGAIQIRFRAVAAGGPRGDIAIDDIEVTGRRLYGDMDSDGIVNAADLSGFVGYWLQENCDLDLDGDCVITLYEFSEFANNWLDDLFQ
jgi:poly(hydroxyalkanoate) depolymerase family esterase